MTLPGSGTPLAGWTVVFDLDGTLVDTAPDLLGALNQILATQGLAPVALTEVRGLIGQGAKAMMRKGFALRGVEMEEIGLEALWADFIDHYIAHIADESVLYPGCLDALNDLCRAGATLAVCTNKTQRLAETLLSTLGVANRFAAIVGADAAPARKPDPRHLLTTLERANGVPSMAIMVGDSQTDAGAANAARMRFVYTPFGYGPKPSDDAEIDAVAPSYAALPDLVYDLAGLARRPR